MNPLDSKPNSMLTQPTVQQMQRQFLHPDTRDTKKLKDASQQFEAIFAQQLLDSMDKTVARENSFLGGGSSEQYWRGMLNEELSKAMCVGDHAPGFGLAESIYRQMAQQAESTAKTGQTAPHNTTRGAS